MPVEKRDVVGRETVTRKESGVSVSESTEVEKVASIVSSSPLCNVGYGLKRTQNLGNYESVTVDVSIHIPCAQADVDGAFAAGEEWVIDKLEQTFARLGLNEDE
ncbi:MAG: hypothetical protein V3S71_06280 [Acidobacteriota bacterium]